MEIVDLKQLRAIQKEILDSIHSFCMTKGIRYSLCAGSLLGAVRHHGYIPWDDDIDIMMPRVDYERFVKEYHSNDNYILDLRKEGHCVELFIKVCRKGTIMIDKMLGRALWGINIDIFPVDGYPDNTCFHCDSILAKKKMVEKLCPIYKSISNKQQRIKWFIKFCAKRVVFFYPHSFLYLKAEIDQMVRAYSIEEEMLGCRLLGGYGYREVLDARLFQSYTDVLFEGDYYRSISDYDTYLKSLYGNYMELPPKEKQVTHHLYDSFFL